MNTVGEAILQAAADPLFMLGLSIGLLTGLTAGWIASWQYRSYKVKNYRQKITDEKGFLITPRKSQWTKVAVTYGSMILFVIAFFAYIFNDDGKEIPFMVSLIAGISAGNALGVNVIEPRLDWLLKRLINGKSKDGQD